MGREFDKDPLYWRDEQAELSDRDTELARIDPNRKLAEDHAAGERTGEFKDEQGPTFHPLNPDELRQRRIRRVRIEPRDDAA